MVTPLRVWLDGRPLDAISEGIWTIGIDEQTPATTVTGEQRGWTDGTLLTRITRNMLLVIVRFEMDLQTYAERVRTMDMVRGWACNGGWLTTSVRPGKRIRVRCTVLPAMTDLKNSTKYTMTFAAYETPWWEDEAPSATVLTGKTSRRMYVDGTVKTTVCDLRVTNTGSTVRNSFAVTVSGTKFAFDGVALSKNDAIVCTHDERGYLVITKVAADGTEQSAYGMRTPDSDDELLAKCGAMNDVACDTANLKVELEARGRWT